MKTSVAGIELIKWYSSFFDKATALDTEGWYVIGWEHHANDISEGTTITPEESEELLEKDLLPIENWVNDHFQNMKQNEFDALVSLVLHHGYLVRESELYKALKSRNMPEIVKRWNMLAIYEGHESPETVCRRLSETCMFVGYIDLKWKPASKLTVTEAKKEVQDIIEWLM